MKANHNDNSFDTNCTEIIIKRKLTPLQAIRLKCLECANGIKKEVRRCDRLECPLYPFRLGRNPNRKGIGRVDNFNKKAKRYKNIPSDSDESEKAHSIEENNTPNGK